jgi:hypothetical protein
MPEEFEEQFAESADATYEGGAQARALFVPARYGVD